MMRGDDKQWQSQLTQQLNDVILVSAVMTTPHSTPTQPATSFLSPLAS